jgi:hypothetical protein
MNVDKLRAVVEMCSGMAGVVVSFCDFSSEKLIGVCWGASPPHWGRESQVRKMSMKTAPKKVKPGHGAPKVSHSSSSEIPMYWLQTIC